MQTGARPTPFIQPSSRWARRTIQKILGGFGYHIAHGPPGWGAILDQSAETVFDVGVGFGTPDLYAAMPTAFFVLIEPLVEYEPAIRQILSEYRGSCEYCALGDNPGTAVIKIPRQDPMRSSIYPRVVPVHGPVEHREVPVMTLDQIVADRDLLPPYGIKLDTEGYELEVLRGAEKTLAQSSFVIAEVSIARRHEGSYESIELISFLHERNLHITNILHMASDRRGQVKHADFLFTR